MTGNDLPFWAFFQRLERELSYERWMDKYCLFLDALFVRRTVDFEDGWGPFKSFCKALYLQDHRHEAQFLQLLDEAIEREAERIGEYYRQAVPPLQQELSSTETEELENPPTNSAKPEKIEQKEKEVKNTKSDAVMPEPAEGQSGRKMFYRPPDTDILDETHNKEGEGTGDFLFTNEYFSVSRRQMIKGWQFLRHREKSGYRDDINLEKTIEKIARDGLFLEPVYHAGTRNRDDVLILYADCRGSMAPFHELTARLVDTARGEGGHPTAPVYYFQNYPTGYVYKAPNLESPIKLKESLAKANRNTTLAVVISDAGAARSNTDKSRSKARLQKTEAFLEELGNVCNHVVWLNPMPDHRWPDTAAALIQQKVFLMAPVFDSDIYNFQETFRAILKQHIRTAKQSP
ncbi:MAG: hypothetical protein EOP49_15500 [Sphingobacteriales bacterium]|nr:MAG: hypothetical protein EOP49_15500 [Sphingobacteriales bacterium]